MKIYSNIRVDHNYSYFSENYSENKLIINDHFLLQNYCLNNSNE